MEVHPRRHKGTILTSGEPGGHLAVPVECLSTFSNSFASWIQSGSLLFSVLKICLCLYVCEDCWSALSTSPVRRSCLPVSDVVPEQSYKFSMAVLKGTTDLVLWAELTPVRDARPVFAGHKPSTPTTLCQDSSYDMALPPRHQINTHKRLSVALHVWREKKLHRRATESTEPSSAEIIGEVIVKYRLGKI